MLYRREYTAAAKWIVRSIKVRVHINYGTVDEKKEKGWAGKFPANQIKSYPKTIRSTVAVRVVIVQISFFFDEGEREHNNNAIRRI